MWWRPDLALGPALKPFVNDTNHAAPLQQQIGVHAQIYSVDFPNCEHSRTQLNEFGAPASQPRSTPRLSADKLLEKSAVEQTAVL
jgi:hypothetical protein